MDITWEFTIFDLLFLIGVVIVFVSFVVSRHYFNIYHAPEQIDRRFIRERWKKIEKLVGYGKEMNFKLAIIEADKLLDHVLREMSFTGETMAERLKIATYKYPELKEVWWAHKARNHVVHDVKYSLKSGEAKKIIGLFKKSLKLLRVL